MNRIIRLKLSRTSSVKRPLGHISKPDREEYLSNDGSCLLQLQKDSEIRFGPAFYSAAIYGGEGKLALDFGARRFFSYVGYGNDSSNWASPWSPTSLSVALLELLSTRPAAGTKIARLNIFDVSRQVPLAAWDFESLVTHKMWSSNGRLYLFRDVYSVYSCLIEQCKLVEISTSKSPHCFLLNDEYVCVIEKTGAVSIFDSISGHRLGADHIAESGYTVQSAFMDDKREDISVVLKNKTEPDSEALCYSVTVYPGN